MPGQRKGNIMGQTESQPESPGNITEAAGILEIALLDIRPGQTARFTRAMAEALPLIRRQPGCHGASLRPCLENPQRYLLQVYWARLTDHDPGFRQSADYRRWRALLHGFYEPFPTVEHYGQPL